MVLKYLDKDSPIHGLDARIKLPLLIFFLLVAILLPVTLAPLPLLIILIAYFLSNIPISRVIKENKILLPVLLLPFVFHFLYQKGTVEFFNYAIPAGAYFAFFNSLYLLSMLLAGMLFILTTRPSELRDALQFFRLPGKIAFMLTLTLQAIPILDGKLLHTRISQASRGRASLLSLLLPSLHSIFSRSKKLAISLESRGFDPEKL